MNVKKTFLTQLKMAVMWLAIRDYISAPVVARLFLTFNLRSL